MNWLWIAILTWFALQFLRLFIAVREPDYSKFTYVVAGIIVVLGLVAGVWR